MKVDISVPGTFHAFELGRQLEKRGDLRRIYTTYPRFKTNIESIPAHRVTNVRHPELLAQAGRQVTDAIDFVPDSLETRTTYWKGVLFDKFVSRKLQRAEDGIFVGFAGVSLESLKRANELGMTTVVERSSSHIRTQKEILDTEYRTNGYEALSISDRQITRETEEYDVADYIVTPSTFARNSFLNRGFEEEKVLNIPLGTRVPDVERASDDDTTYFVYSGNVSLRKGIQYLLPAWESLDLPDAELIITSNIKPSAQSLVQRYTDVEDVCFTGWVDDLHKLFGNSSVFVFPSVEDGFGKVVIEAMAAGLPAIVSENTGAKDCIIEGMNGHVVPARDSGALANAIRNLYQNPGKRKQMGENAYQHIKSKYTEEDYGERVLAAYRSMQS
jgi:glycosyltransferase involved in cell wall biosynthesis